MNAKPQRFSVTNARQPHKVVGKAVWPFALLLFLAGVLLAAATFYVPSVEWFRQNATALSDPGNFNLGRLIVSLMLIALSYGLMRRRQLAYYVTLVMAAFGAVILESTTWTVIFTFFSLALALCRGAYVVPAQDVRVRTALKVGIAMFVTGYVYLQMSHHYPLPELTMRTLLLTIGLATLLIAQMSAPAPLPAGATERARVKRLVEVRDSDTLAPFALRHDKSYVFSADGRAAIGYRVLLGVAVAGGDPVGHADAVESAIQAFMKLCERKGWEPSVLGVRMELAPVWRRYGLSVLSIGDEVILDVNSFTLVGRKMLNVRQSVAHTRKVGVTTEICREGELSRELRAQLQDLSERWLKGKTHHGFSMILDGMLTGTHPDALLVIARDGEGHPVGFQRYAACGVGKALSLDTMRRDRNGPACLNERMIVDLTEYARERGIESISLNFAAFRPLLDAGATRTPMQQAAYQALHLLDPFIQVESLYRFNAKFRPGFLERGVALPSLAVFPAALMALLGLEFALPYDRTRNRLPAPELETAMRDVVAESKTLS